MAHWWCNTCKQAILSCNVTYGEYHDNCGTPAEWINDDELSHEELTQHKQLLQQQIMELKEFIAGQKEVIESLQGEIIEQAKYAELGKSVSTLRPIEDLHEDHGDVLLWQLPICEAPDVGSCIDCNFDENLYTHWSPLPADLWETVAMDTKKRTRLFIT